MPGRIHLSAILFVAALLWGAALVVIGLPVTIAYLKPFSLVTGCLVLALSAFDLWLWRVPVLQGWFVKRPQLWGTWRVRFDSDWADPGGNQREPRIGYLAIRQTFSTLTMSLMTNESTSALVAEGLTVSPDGSFKVFGVYRNEPKIAVRDRSPIHYGAVMLDVQGSPVETLAGSYWTDRKTRGDLLLTDRRTELCGSFESARRTFGD